jgi:hypothetical protein
MQKTVARADGMNVGFGGRGGDELRGFHLQVIVLNKKKPDRLDHTGTQPQVLFPAGQIP